MFGGLFQCVHLVFRSAVGQVDVDRDQPVKHNATIFSSNCIFGGRIRVAGLDQVQASQGIADNSFV